MTSHGKSMHPRPAGAGQARKTPRRGPPSLTRRGNSSTVTRQLHPSAFQAAHAILQRLHPKIETKLAKGTSALLAVARRPYDDFVLVEDNKGQTTSDSKAVRGHAEDLKLMLKSVFQAGYGYRSKFFSVGNLTTNGTAGKYLLLVAGAPGTGYTIGAFVSGLAEWSSLNSLFDEFFVHSVHFRFEPTNRHSANSTANTGTVTAAGQPGLINTLGLAWAGYQHNQGAASDTSTAVAILLTSSLAKWASSGDPHTFTWRNNEKFVKDGPLGDMTTSGSTQMWCNVASAAAYGGRIQAAVAEPTGASALIGTLYETALMGHLVVEYDISFRVRS